MKDFVITYLRGPERERSVKPSFKATFVMVAEFLPPSHCTDHPVRLPLPVVVSQDTRPRGQGPGSTL
jgi:hypothetical protein